MATNNPSAGADVPALEGQTSLDDHLADEADLTPTYVHEIDDLAVVVDALRPSRSPFSATLEELERHYRAADASLSPALAAYRDGLNAGMLLHAGMATVDDTVEWGRRALWYRGNGATTGADVDEAPAVCPGRHHMEWAGYAGPVGNPDPDISVLRCEHCDVEALVDTLHDAGDVFRACDHADCAEMRESYGLDRVAVEDGVDVGDVGDVDDGTNLVDDGASA